MDWDSFFQLRGDGLDDTRGIHSIPATGDGIGHCHAKSTGDKKHIVDVEGRRAKGICQKKEEFPRAFLDSIRSFKEGLRGATS